MEVGTHLPLLPTTFHKTFPKPQDVPYGMFYLFKLLGDLENSNC